jgi:hypothetical protein
VRRPQMRPAAAPATIDRRLQGVFRAVGRGTVVRGCIFLRPGIDMAPSEAKTQFCQAAVEESRRP